MNKFNFICLITGLVIAVAGCTKEGEEGPQGPAGPQGLQGPNAKIIN